VEGSTSNVTKIGHFGDAVCSQHLGWYGESGYLNARRTGVLRQLVCVLIQSDAVTSSAIYGSVYGLVVITLERYVKIVHPVAHRNHYRRWMTYVGVATPWLIGLLTSTIPSLTTTNFVDGRCSTQVGPNKAAICSND